jgi:hypothetical protein
VGALPFSVRASYAPGVRSSAEPVLRDAPCALEKQCRLDRVDSLFSVDVPPRYWVEEALCPEESFCSGELVPCADGVRFLGEPLSAKAGDSLGEPLSGDKGCSHHEARSPSETHSAGEVRRNVAPSYAARFQGEKGYSPVCSRGWEQWCWGVVELRDSREPGTVLRTGWRLRPRDR